MLIMCLTANYGLKLIVSVNRVRVVKHCLAVFDPVFLLDSSLESTFAQNKSCRSYRPLQLLFWQNFIFQCKIWSFGRSNSAKNHSISINCDSPVFAQFTTGLDVGVATRRAGEPLAA